MHIVLYSVFVSHETILSLQHSQSFTSHHHFQELGGDLVPRGVVAAEGLKHLGGLYHIQEGVRNNLLGVRLKVAVPRQLTVGSLGQHALQDRSHLDNGIKRCQKTPS